MTGRNTTESTETKGRADPLTAEVQVGKHEGCGGEVYFKMDNPMGTYECKKCNKRARSYELLRTGFSILRKRIGG
jgi:hypothetical protein